MNAGGRRKSMLRDRQFTPRDTAGNSSYAGSGSHPPGSKYTGDTSSGELPSVSLSRLTRSEFQAEEYLKETLKAVPEGGLRQFRKALEEARKAASKNLQRNVYKNYESFVFISKEISSMERDMQLLRELLHSINQVGGDLMEEDTDAEEEGRVGRRRTMRMSMANQNDLFKEQLAKVWASIRDAQRFVPFAPGRHVLGDVRNVAELSPSTMQPRQRVDIVVLSDMLLLAVRTKRGAHAQPALVADRSFALADVSVAEVADSARANNLVRITNRAETFLFGFRSADAKSEMLLLISHAKAGFFGSEPPPGMPPPVPVDPRAQSAPPRTRGDAEDGGAARPGAEMLDELDVLIARREFDAATAAVQRISARAADAPLQPAVRRAVDAHTGELARLILADLLIPCSPRPQVAASVQLLHRLGWDKEAKEAFLASRSSTIKNRTRQLKLEGNTGMYIRELAVVYFRLIRNTCEWYSAFFADPTLVSALIAWVRQEMAGYAVIFRRHVFHEMQKFQVIAGCLNHTLAEVNILGHAGLDLKFMLDQEFFPDLTSCIRSYEARCLAVMAKTVAEDPLAVASRVSISVHSDASGAQTPIIASVSKLDEVLIEFGNELRHIVRDSLYGQVVASVLAIIEGVLKQFLNILRKTHATITQEFALLVSTQAVVSWVIPRSATHLDRIFGRTVSDIHNLEQRLEAFPGTLQDVFCQKQAVAVSKSSFDFVTATFTQEDQVTDDMQPSMQMETLLRQLGEISRELDRWPLPKRPIISGIIDCMFVQMIDPRNWETSTGEKRKFSHFGVHCLVLDIHFLLRVCGSLVSKSTNNMANRVCEKALRLYFTNNSNQASGNNKEMKNKSWYDKRVLETMQRLGFGFPDFGKGFEHRSQQSFDSLGNSGSGSAASSSRNTTGSPSVE